LRHAAFNAADPVADLVEPVEQHQATEGQAEDQLAEVLHRLGDL
jgi:hypothetical protein